MNNFFITADIMMEICMWICRMCMTFCAFIFDMFSIFEKTLYRLNSGFTLL